MKKKIKTLSRYLILIVVGLLLIYPLLFMIFGTVKTNQEIFTSLKLLPDEWTISPIEVFKEGWDTGTQFTMTTYFLNSFKYVFVNIIFTVISVVPTAYAIARYEFKGKKVVFALVIGTLLVPASLFTIPLFVMWSHLGLTNSYIPLVLPSLFATNSFFVFMLIQFFRTIPRSLDEASLIDGCNSWQTLTKILVPIISPAIITVALLTFVWGMADFQGPLIYISSAAKFPVTLAIKLLFDADVTVPYNVVFAMSLISLIPSVVVFFSAQKYFVEGLSSGGVKG
ncbi:MAG: carbohydrate ABC transporter permease [Coprobacillaceae bacterium]